MRYIPPFPKLPTQHDGAHATFFSLGHMLSFFRSPDNDPTWPEFQTFIMQHSVKKKRYEGLQDYVLERFLRALPECRRLRKSRYSSNGGFATSCEWVPIARVPFRRSAGQSAVKERPI